MSLVKFDSEKQSSQLVLLPALRFVRRFDPKLSNLLNSQICVVHPVPKPGHNILATSKHGHEASNLNEHHVARSPTIACVEFDHL